MEEFLSLKTRSQVYLTVVKVCFLGKGKKVRLTGPGNRRWAWCNAVRKSYKAVDLEAINVESYDCVSREKRRVVGRAHTLFASKKSKCKLFKWRGLPGMVMWVWVSGCIMHTSSAMVECIETHCTQGAILNWPRPTQHEERICSRDILTLDTNFMDCNFTYSLCQWSKLLDGSSFLYYRLVIGDFRSWAPHSTVQALSFETRA